MACSCCQHVGEEYKLRNRRYIRTAEKWVKPSVILLNDGNPVDGGKYYKCCVETTTFCRHIMVESRYLYTEEAFRATISLAGIAAADVPWCSIEAIISKQLQINEMLDEEENASIKGPSA